MLLLKKSLTWAAYWIITGPGRWAGLPKETWELTPGGIWPSSKGGTPEVLGVWPGTCSPAPLPCCSSQKRGVWNLSFSGGLPPYTTQPLQASMDAGLLLFPALWGFYTLGSITSCSPPCPTEVQSYWESPMLAHHLLWQCKISLRQPQATMPN